MLARLISVRERVFSQRHFQQGFTLIELIVSIAVVGILIGLMLPAVSEARQTARRMQCSSHLRQIGIGLHSYHNVHSSFPAGHLAHLERGRDGKSWGWGALLLPYIEKQALSQRLDTSRRSFDAIASDLANAHLIQTSIGIYRCPSDPGDDLSHAYRSIIVSGPAASSGSSSLTQEDSHRAHIFTPPNGGGAPMAIRVAKSNYVGSFGNKWKTQRYSWDSEDFEGNGLFGRNSSVRFSDVFDGSSFTLAIGERSIRNYAAVWAGGNSWLGCGFGDNQMVIGTAFYPINDPPVSTNIDCNGRGSANFSSYHHGGANFLFADGSVHFIRQELDEVVFRNLSQRDDGKKILDF
ncbi:MAG: DUF1559 domain-containing protein [Planctomycetota bacterium]